MGQKVRLFQDFVDTGLNRIVVITGSGQTVLSVGAITPEATDDLTGKLVHGLRGLGVHQLSVRKGRSGMPQALKSVASQ